MATSLPAVLTQIPPHQKCKDILIVLSGWEYIGGCTQPLSRPPRRVALTLAISVNYWNSSGKTAKGCLSAINAAVALS
ncbi:hypothetical protein J6590_010307 [Homalodisca vitripennis]|nr:hypothetical protein J6590_010307 [Homalodisca vitripennis]